VNAFIIEPPRSATAAVIWLHGLGASGHDFEPIVPALPAVVRQHTRFIFPHAPHRSITINGGIVMPGWYDIMHVDLTAQQDAAGIQASAHLVYEYLAQIINQGIPSHRIILAGFSQGGAIALHAGLRYAAPLAGIIALSSYLPLADKVASECHTANSKVPIFMAHGQLDPVILLAQAQHSRAQLEQLDYSVEWHSYPTAHNVSALEIQELGNWLATRLPSSP
jgi:phospholipase/carboxylesterase